MLRAMRRRAREKRRDPLNLMRMAVSKSLEATSHKAIAGWKKVCTSVLDKVVVLPGGNEATQGSRLIWDLVSADLGLSLTPNCNSMLTCDDPESDLESDDLDM